MICADLLNISELCGLKLCAGKEGLDRTVRWIYFADSLAAESNANNLENWFSGGEILVFTSDFILCDKVYAIDIMNRACLMNISCMMIENKFMDNDFADFAEKHRLPLFVLPDSMRSVDLSQVICTRLINEQAETNNTERILSSVLFTGYDSADRIISNAAYYGLDINGQCCAAVFVPLEFEKYLEACHKKDRDEINLLKNSYFRVVRQSFRDVFGKSVMAMLRDDSVILLFNVQNVQSEKSDLLERAENEIERGLSLSAYGLDFCIGTGNVFSGLDGIKNSYYKAVKSVRLRFVLDGKKLVKWSQLGIYSILFDCEDRAVLEDFSSKYLGALDNYDRINGTDLCETYGAYLKYGRNANLTAEKLYVHRNTLRYRLEKIKQLLGENCDTPDSCVNFMAAYKIRQFYKGNT